MNMITVNFVLNGEEVSAETKPNRKLVEFLRDLGCKSVKEGCSEGECGSCTILLNGKPVTSCLMLAGQVDGEEVITLEGLEKDGELSNIQENFLTSGAVQCGYCTPGMILSTKALLNENPNPTRYEIKRALSGNLCRCTGYSKIFDAVELSAEQEK